MRIHGSRVLHALTSMVDALDELDVAAGIMSKTIDTHFDFNVQNIKKYEVSFQGHTNCCYEAKCAFISF